MNNTTLQLKIKQRVNKLASNDYDNIEAWQIVEAFNKAQIEWSRRQIRGSNPFRDGDEQSGRRIDDLQHLLKEFKIPIVHKPLYYETVDVLPSDYLEYKRIDVEASQECCEGERPMIVYLAEEDNKSQLLRDVMKKPSFEWAETFSTLISNKARIHTNGEFELKNALLVYYRKPILIQIAGSVDPYSGLLSAVDVESEFKDDIVELLIDETAALLAGDFESGNQFGRGTQAAERNN